MSFITIGRTTAYPEFDSGMYKGKFVIANEYLGGFWFKADHEIWTELQVAIAAVTDKIVEKRLPEILNKEALQKRKQK